MLSLATYFFVSYRTIRQLPAYTRTSHVGPIARLDELKGSGRIYLFRLGQARMAYSVDDFAQWLRVKYGLDVEVLPAVPLDSSSWDSGRRQYVAELLYAEIKRDHPNLAADPNAYLIAFMDDSMHSVQNDWDYSFSQRDMHRIAVISASDLQDSWLDRMRNTGLANQHLQARLRRILLKDIAVLYWHLPLNTDPTSLLHDTLDPDIPAEDVYESDLDPAHGEWGQSEGEPCLFFSYTASEGINPLPGNPIRSCADQDLPIQDEKRELLEVDLRLGLLVDKHTDFYLPDVIPIQFQRATRDSWTTINPFGINGTDNYDQYLASSDNIHISVIHNDGGWDELVRTPIWLPTLALVKYVDTNSGKYYQMRWHRQPFEHYDITRYDGVVQTYLPCENQQFCYLIGYRNAEGQALTFKRDDSRKLIQLTSPNQSWLHFSYGVANHISEIADSRHRRVLYAYDSHNRLSSVTYPSGEVLYYKYDDQQHLLAFSASPDAATPPRLLLTNEYVDGKLTKQTFANGDTYAYNYYPARDGIQAAVVQAPGGRLFQVRIDSNGSVIREADSAPRP